MKSKNAKSWSMHHKAGEITIVHSYLASQPDDMPSERCYIRIKRRTYAYMCSTLEVAFTQSLCT